MVRVEAGLPAPLPPASPTAGTPAPADFGGGDARLGLTPRARSGGALSSRRPGGRPRRSAGTAAPCTLGRGGGRASSPPSCTPRRCPGRVREPGPSVSDGAIGPGGREPPHPDLCPRPGRRAGGPWSQSGRSVREAGRTPGPQGARESLPLEWFSVRSTVPNCSRFEVTPRTSRCAP